MIRHLIDKESCSILVCSSVFSHLDYAVEHSVLMDQGYGTIYHKTFKKPKTLKPSKGAQNIFISDSHY